MDDPGRGCGIRLNPTERRRTQIAGGVVLVGLVVVAVVLRLERSQELEVATGPQPPAAVFAPSTTTPVVAAVTGLGPDFSAERQLRPTGDAGQSKTWFHDGRWWGVLLAEDEFRVHAYDPAGGWTDTGTLVDPRPTSHADVLAEGDTVLVAGAGRGASAANAVEVRRFVYDADDRLYRADRQYPVRVSRAGARHVTLARSGAGQLWLAFVTDQRLEVAHSTDDDRNWSDPAPIPLPEASEPIDAAAVAASGDRVAVLAATVAGSVVALTTTDGVAWDATPLLAGAAPDVERVVALRNGPASGPAFLGLTEVAPATEGNLFAPHLVAFASADGSTWTSHAVSRVDDRLADPTLLIDEGAGTAVVLATSEGSIRAKSAPLDRLVFPSGRGVPLLPADVGGLFREPATSRTAPAGAGLVVLAADSGIGRYGFASVGVPPIASATGQAEIAVLLADDFDGRPAGSGPPPGWELSSDAGSGELLLTDGREEQALQLRSAQAGSARACRRFVTAQPAPIRLTQTFRVAGGGTGDAVVASLRGVGETASIRIDDRGRVAWFDGATKRNGAGSVAPATWYRLEVQVDPGTRRYDFVVTDLDGSEVARVKSAAWRAEDARVPDQLCISTREGARADLAIDDLEILR